MTTTAPLAVVLAAGKGTRMGSDLPKVLHQAAGKTLLEWVLDALTAAGCTDQIVVIGHGAELVRETIGGRPGVQFAVQHQQRGTGDAVRAAADTIKALASPTGKSEATPDRPVIIVCGDSPLLRAESVTGLLSAFRERQAACLLGTALADDATGLGRIVRNAAGRFQRIVEEKDASAAERMIHEVNMSTYIFAAGKLLWALDRLNTENAAGEYYLTDCPQLLLENGDEVDAVACLDSSETLSVNTPEQLAAVADALAAAHR
ncbi:MAG: glycosyl transferase family 2 [Planctomycetia bacterium]|nr:glycosyl transferase family 2 [Planctomycetia bacterium]